MAKVFENEEIEGMYNFECLGCGMLHFINTNPNYGGVWEFNGNLDNPTVSPSLLIKSPNLDGSVDVCHFFVKNGNIEYLSDCTHNRRSTTVEMPNIY